MLKKSRENVERQIERATSVLQTHVKTLKDQSVEEKAYRRDPLWRRLNAGLRQVNARLKRITAIEEQNVKLAQEKAERIANPIVKVKKKKARPETKKPRGMGGGGAQRPAKAKPATE